MNVTSPALARAMLDGSFELPSLKRHASSEPEAVRGWPRRMRLAAVEVLRDWGLADLADDVQLVVSELATNAVLHTTASEATVRLRRHESALRVEVEATGSSRRAPEDARSDEERGRGLLIVKKLAIRWGTNSDGSLVWCEIGFQPAARELPSQQALTFLRTELPPNVDAALRQARAFVRSTATALGWRGDVESAAHTAAALTRNSADRTATSFWLGLAVDQKGSLIIEIEDDQRAFDGADHVARLLSFVTGAHVSWNPTAEGRAVRAALPVQQVERVGGAA
ncbi:ATP-binding protein [Streptomyces sp. NPDC055103]